MKNLIISLIALMLILVSVLAFVAQPAPASTNQSSSHPSKVAPNVLYSNSNPGTISISGNNQMAYDTANRYMYLGGNGLEAITPNGTLATTVSLGYSPFGVAYDSGNGNIYTSNLFSDIVSVVSPSNKLIGTINVGSGPAGIAYDPANGNIYVANSGSGNVSVISSSNRVIASVNVGSVPAMPAYDPVNNNIYVPDFSSNNVSVISPANTVMASVAVGSNPFGAAFDAASGNIYITNHASNNVSVISPANKVVASIPVGTEPYGIATDIVTGNLYVANHASYDVSVIAPTNTVLFTVGLSDYYNPYGIGYDPSNANVYVANAGSTSLSVITTSLRTSTNINVEYGPHSSTYDPANGNIYVTTTSLGSVSVISPLNKVVGKINVGQPSFGIAYDPSNGYVYEADYGTDNISVISTLNNTIIATINIGLEPNKLAYVPANGNMYVTAYNNTVNYVMEISSSNNTVVGNISVVSLPEQLAYDPSNGYLYVSYYNIGTITVISPISNDVVSSLSVGPLVRSLAYDSVNGNMYIAYTSYSPDGYLLAVSPSNKEMGTLNLGASNPSDIAFDPGNGNLYVTVRNARSVLAISPSTNSVVETAMVGDAPTGITYNAMNGNLYVSNFAGNTVTVLNTAQDMLEFTQAGLPSGSQWNLTLGGQTYTSTTNTIALASYPGVFNYSITSPLSRYTPSIRNGTVDVKSGYTHVAIKFSRTYPVEFNRTGLPVGMNWSVTINGMTMNSNSSIYFNLTNGTHPYTINKVPGYSLSSGPYNSSVTVSGHSELVNTTWVRAASRVTFIQSGLPSGLWYVNITGRNTSGPVSSSSNYIIYLANGTYNYSISTSNKKYMAEGNSFTVGTSPLNISIAFKPVYYTLTFIEMWIEPSDTVWHVNLSNGYHLSTMNRTVSVQIQNGTYGYNATVSGPEYVPATGNVTIDGSNTSVHIMFMRGHENRIGREHEFFHDPFMEGFHGIFLNNPGRLFFGLYAFHERESVGPTWAPGGHNR